MPIAFGHGTILSALR